MLSYRVVLAALLTWLATYAGAPVRWRRPWAYFALAVVLTAGITGALKAITNVDCPWDLAMFGGRFPHVPLFADRPDHLRPAHCFPAAHAASGYALMALYFVFRERGRALALAGLGTGILLGLVFGFAQQSRGAHFLSHDLWSALLAWAIPSTLYAVAFRCRLWIPRWSPEPRQGKVAVP